MLILVKLYCTDGCKTGFEISTKLKDIAVCLARVLGFHVYSVHKHVIPMLNGVMIKSNWPELCSDHRRQALFRHSSLFTVTIMIFFINLYYYTNGRFTYTVIRVVLHVADDKSVFIKLFFRTRKIIRHLVQIHVLVQKNNVIIKKIPKTDICDFQGI